MLEYRRLHSEAVARAQALEDRQRDFDGCVRAFVLALGQISTDLSIIPGLDLKAGGAINSDSSFVTAILQGAAPTTINQSLDSIRSNLSQSIAKVASLMSSTGAPGGEQLDRLRSQCHTLSSENTDLKTTNAFQSNQIQELLTELETVKAAKIVSDRKYDRLRLAADPVPTQQPNGSSQQQQQHNQQGAILGSAGSSSTSLIANEADAASMAASAAASSEWELLCQSRLKEIEQLTAQNLELSQQFESYKINNGFQQGEPLVRQSVVLGLEARLEQANQSSLLYKKRADDLQIELSELKADQRKFMDSIESEELARRKVLENELKKMETDLARVRTHRDNLAEQAQLQKEKDAFEVHQHKEVMFLAGSQKSKIQELESKIERLKMKLVANDADSFLREFFLGGEEGEAMETDENVFSELKKRLDASEAKANELERLLRSFENATRDMREKQEVLFSESSLRSELERVRAELASLNPEASKTVADLEVKIELYQKSEARLIQEIEMLSAAWTDLETQNQRKVFNLAEKEDQIIKLISERTKFDQKCERLTKERNMINNQVIALKRQSERQLEQIRKLEERERGLNVQLQALEKELATKTVAADVHRRKVTELNQKQSDLVEKLDKLHAKFTEAERVLGDKMKQLAEESHTQKRLLEKIDVLKKRLDNQPKTSEMADSHLQQENEDLKLLVKCSSCSNNFKSHILLKCMHTFCKTCLDDLVNSRQRKCPKCGIGFGQGDIKPFYL
ncbi:hypothetical protein BDR26DRAFT_874249 [Obelidium mucronatum]|nr:hypothetical protein BDR26DRAFT_874249 [Obelidium mucronatum]